MSNTRLESGFNPSSEGTSSSNSQSGTAQEIFIQIRDLNDSSNTIKKGLAKHKLKYRIAFMLNTALYLGCTAGFGYMFYIIISNLTKHFHLGDLIEEEIIGENTTCKAYGDKILKEFDDQSNSCVALLAALEVKDIDPDSYVHYCHELIKEYCKDPLIDSFAEGVGTAVATLAVAMVFICLTYSILNKLKQDNYLNQSLNAILDEKTTDNVLAIIKKYNLIDPKSLPIDEVDNHIQVNLALNKLAIDKDLIKELVQAKTYSTLFLQLQRCKGEDNSNANPFYKFPTELICKIGLLTMTSTATSTCCLFAESSAKVSKKGKEKVDEVELENVIQNDQEVTSKRVLKFKKGIFNRLIKQPEEILIDTKNGQIYFNK